MEELIWCGSNGKSGGQENCCQDVLKKKKKKKREVSILPLAFLRCLVDKFTTTMPLLAQSSFVSSGD